MRTGRPPKKPKDRQTNVLRVCLTDSERSQLDRAAMEKTSTWAREVLLRAAKRSQNGR